MTRTLEIEKRLRELLAEESGQPLQWWYLSYADEEFRGGIIVEAPGFASAVMTARLLGISPGGSVRGLPIPPDEIPLESYRNRLLTKAELEEFWEMERPDA